MIRFFLYGGDKPTVTDWQSVFNEFSAHAILPLAGIQNRIKELDDLPPELQTIWIRMIQNGIRRYLMVHSAGKQLTDLLAGCKTVPLILKGAAAGLYFPDPLCRTYGDIDFLVIGEKDASDVRTILSENGYTETEQIAEEQIRHYAFTKNNVSFELHRYFSHRNNRNEKALDTLLESAAPVLRGDFYSPDDALNGLVLLAHLKQHLCSTGVGMRQVIDFLCFTEKILTDAFWKERFEALTVQTGLRTFAIHTVRMCEMYFGIAPHAFAREADEDVCRLMMEEICAAGNFGMKRSSVNNRIAVFSSGNPFVRLQKVGLKNWKAAQKHRILRPFAWLHQSFRILGILLHSLFRGETPASGLRQGQRIRRLKKKLRLR